VRFAIEDSYDLAAGFPAFPGLVVDFLASRGVGVSYGLTVPSSDDNYVNAYAGGYPGQTISPYSMLVPFTYAGVAGVYMARPPAALGPQEQFTYRSYFVVGKGDVASVLDTIYELRGEPTGTLSGHVIDHQTSQPIAHANVIILDANDHVVDQAETDDHGSFVAHLAAGAYTYTAMADDRLSTKPVAFRISAGLGSAPGRSRWRRRRRSWCRRSTSSGATRRRRSSCSATSRPRTRAKIRGASSTRWSAASASGRPRSTAAIASSRVRGGPPTAGCPPRSGRAPTT